MAPAMVALRAPAPLPTGTAPAAPTLPLLTAPAAHASLSWVSPPRESPSSSVLNDIRVPALCGVAAAAAAALSRSWRGGQLTKSLKSVRQASAGSSARRFVVPVASRPRAAAVGLRALSRTTQPGLDLPDQASLQLIFEEASGGKDSVTLDQALLLEGIDAVLDEGAVSLKEMEMLWGDDEDPLDFPGFAKWYCGVLKLYDEYLMKDAVMPPSELMDDLEEGGIRREYTDDELLEDMPTQGQNISDLMPDVGEKVQAVERQDGRTNVEITQLFREGCDENNLLSFEGLQEVSEINQLLKDEEMTLDELKEMWAATPQSNGTIDVLNFRDLLKKIDDLFEFVEDDEEEPAPVKRDPAKLKADLLVLVDSLLDAESKAAGLDGRDETDQGVLKLCSELEDSWRDTVTDLDDFDLSPLCGDWELLYNTSAKFRRWGSVLNTGRDVPDAIFEACVQNFSMDSDKFANEYDMEELFLSNGEELAIRAMGSWNVGSQPNVVTNEEDLVVKLQLNDVEYDTAEGEVKVADQKTLGSQMCRTFAYMYIAYLDDDLRIMRTGLTGTAFFIWRKLPPEDED